MIFWTFVIGIIFYSIKRSFREKFNSYAIVIMLDIITRRLILQLLLKYHFLQRCDLFGTFMLTHALDGMSGKIDLPMKKKPGKAWQLHPPKGLSSSGIAIFKTMPGTVGVFPKGQKSPGKLLFYNCCSTPRMPEIVILCQNAVFLAQDGATPGFPLSESQKNLCTFSDDFSRRIKSVLLQW